VNTIIPPADAGRDLLNRVRAVLESSSLESRMDRAAGYDSEVVRRLRALLNVHDAPGDPS
jgi:hypothetical protein